ncbi:MAG: hypothetical protein ACEPO2_19870 [Pelagibaca sp.]
MDHVSTFARRVLGAVSAIHWGGEKRSRRGSAFEAVTGQGGAVALAIRRMGHVAAALLARPKDKGWPDPL